MKDGFVVFDLDNTLVDSDTLKPLRDSRKWNDVYLRINEVQLFDGMREAWDELDARGFRLCIVTHSPRKYAQMVLNRLKVSPRVLITFHDLAGNLKPSPFGYSKAIEGGKYKFGWAIGDQENDLAAASALPCHGIMAGWARNASISSAVCKANNWLYARHPSDLPDLIRP